MHHFRNTLAVREFIVPLLMYGENLLIWRGKKNKLEENLMKTNFLAEVEDMFEIFSQEISLRCSI